MDGAAPVAEADAGGSEAGVGARLTEDLIMEILTRLPAKSLHRFKCVSRQWFGLISDPKHRAKLAQTLAGFFYIGYSTDRERRAKSLHFTTARPDDGPPPLIDPSALSVPPSCRKHLHRVDCVNGLLLLRFWRLSTQEGHRYAVCNPATDEWTLVPYSPTRGAASFARLAVADDRAASSSSPLHFRVFEFRAGGARCCILSAEIYSSETGSWTHRECRWDVGVGISLRDDTSGVFFRGALHLAPIEPVLASVDGEGNVWRTSRKPSNPDDSGFLGGPAPGFIGLSQGRLHFLNTMERDNLKLCDWELDDDSGVWLMKHTVDLRNLFTLRWPFSIIGVEFRVIGIHPDCNIVYFLQGKNNTLMSYAMDRAQGVVIRDLERNNYVPYLPYVPLFSAPLAIRQVEDEGTTCSSISHPVVVILE